MNDQDILTRVINEGMSGRAPHLYGAAVVKDGEVIAIAHNEVWDTSDPSAHAEVRAIVAACKKLKMHNLPEGCILYGSHEPCLMCFMCGIWANISEFAFAHPASDVTRDTYGFKDISLEQIAAKLNKQVKIRHVHD